MCLLPNQVIMVINANSQNYGAMIRNTILVRNINVTPSNHLPATLTGSTNRAEDMNHTDSAAAPAIYQGRFS